MKRMLKFYMMKRLAGVLLVLLLSSTAVFSQNTIAGTFPSLANQAVSLKGYKGFQTYVIDSSQINEEGNFVLNYTADDYGMGYLVSGDKEPYMVVLSGEAIALEGHTFSNPETIDILKGRENQLFEQYASEHPRREQALSAWGYLENIYTKDSLFSVQEVPKQAIAKEKQRIKAEDSLFLARLNPEGYLSWYLPLRKLVRSVRTIAQYRTEEIPAALASFRAIDYTSPRLQKSGLPGELIESHFWLIENSGRSLDSVYVAMHASIDVLIENLLADPDQLNAVSEFLFKLLEKRSLFRASEYLALKLLNEQGCTLNNDFAAQLESYRAMKKGTVAPDFDFPNEVMAPGYEVSEQPQTLSDLQSQYTVVLFGASWCPQCPQDLSQIAGFYEKWKKQGVEVVFVSLDDDESTFKRFAGVFPFISLCDYKKWESPIVKNYHVFATPTLYLLDHKREILLRPNSVGQLDAWVDWYLVQGNMQPE
jgi:thiol-disulfide isomerase/thioredoxin